MNRSKNTPSQQEPIYRLEPLDRASFEDELTNESTHPRIKIIRPTELGEVEGYDDEDDEDDDEGDVKGHLMRVSGRGNTSNTNDDGRARLADRSSSNKRWMAARRRGNNNSSGTTRRLIRLIKLIGSLLIITLLVLIIHFSIIRSASSVKSFRIDWKDGPRPLRMIDLKDWGSGFGLIFPKVGSKRWAQLYPASKPSGPRPRQPWVDRYDHLISISSPNRSDSPLYHALVTPRARLSHTSGLAEYPDGIDLGSSGICSYRRKSCLRDLSSTSEGGEVDGLADIWFGRPKTWSINFDDGPLPPSESLYQFLDLHQQKATHFWIGSNVRDYPQLAIRAMERGDHLAVHTWSHAHLTTLSDLEIVGELGWTIQIIFDLTGIVPLYYRPPYGDVDNRVRAIAKHVFGLKTLMWNCDSSDWTLNQTYAIGDFVDPPMGGFGLNQSVDQIRSHQRSITNQKDGDDVVPGKIILEHELSLESVEAFRVTYEGLERLGWATCTVADCIGSDWYQQK